MSDNYIINVLNILRLIKAGQPGDSALGYLRGWAGSDQHFSTILKMAAYVHEQCEGAATQLTLSEMPEEARAGLLQTIAALRQAFLVEQLGGNMSNFLPHLESSVSQFAMYAGLTGQDAKTSANDDLQKLIDEVEQLHELFEDTLIDPIVSETARRHLHVLLTLLRNVDALGLDSAMAAYSELVIRLKRADSTASEQSRARTAGLWDRLLGWQERFKKIDDAVSTGTKWLGYGKAAAILLGFKAG